MNIQKLIGLFLIALILSANITYAEFSNLMPSPILRVRNNTGNSDFLSGTTATVFTFDGSGSTDYETNSSLLEVRFDFENDGKLDTFFNRDKTTQHRYIKPGIKTVRMDVLDREGNVASAYKQVVVVENTPPDAFFKITPLVGTPGTTFKLDASLSSDSQYNRNILELRYDFENDGIWDTPFTKTKFTHHKFNKTGLNTVVLEVRDPEGVSSFMQKQVFIKENTPPVSSFTAVKELSRGDFVTYTLDASKSTDIDNPEIRYKWDYDYTGPNDIIWDTNWLSSPVNRVYFKKAGEFVIRLMVKDEDEEKAVSFLRLFVDLN